MIAGLSEPPPNPYNPPVFLFHGFATILGLIVGSFLNVCIRRVPQGESIVYPGSRCPVCLTPLQPWENLPLVSYLLLRGRCRSCGEKISWVYPLVEALTGLSFYLLFARYGPSWAFLVNAVFLCLIVVLVFIDLFERLLPNVFTVGGMVFGFLAAPLQSPQIFSAAAVSVPDRILWAHYLDSSLGLLIGGGFLWAVAKAYFRLRKVQGMGFGDIKMMGMVGAFIGWQLAWLTILIGSLLGAVIGSAYMLVKGEGRGYELPFGTFLGAGAVISLFWGRELLRLYFLLF